MRDMFWVHDWWIFKTRWKLKITKGLIEEFWDFYQNKRRILNQQNFLKRDVLERLTKRDLGMRDGVDIFV
jgi:hypothetical protein